MKSIYRTILIVAFSLILYWPQLQVFTPTQQTNLRPQKAVTYPSRHHLSQRRILAFNVMLMRNSPISGPRWAAGSFLEELVCSCSLGLPAAPVFGDPGLSGFQFQQGSSPGLMSVISYLNS